MAIVEIDEIAALVANHRRLLGLDVGSKTIGVAVSDAMGIAATPIETIARGKFAADAARLAWLAKDRGVAAIVIGMPTNMDGSSGPRVQSTKAFARNLAAQLPLPIAFWDERLSTAAVTRMMIDADFTRRRRAELVDNIAAAYILQGALERCRVLGRQSAD